MGKNFHIPVKQFNILAAWNQITSMSGLRQNFPNEFLNFL